MPIGAAAASLIGGGISSLTSIFNNRKQQKYNEQLAGKTYGQNLDMWNKQNKYNAPAQQMARFKEAGLNPNLIYGNGTTSSGNSGQVPTYQEQAPDFSRRQAPNPADMLATYNSLALAKENVIMAKTRSQIETDQGVIIAKKMQPTLQASLTGYNAEFKRKQNVELAAQNEYAKENAYAQYLTNNRGATKIGLENTWKELQTAVYQNTTSKGLTLDQGRLQQGWTDILNGNFLTPQAKSIYIDAGSYGLSMLKNIVPAKILQGINSQKGGGTRISTRFDSKGKRTGMTRTRTLNNN